MNFQLQQTLFYFFLSVCLTFILNSLIPSVFCVFSQRNLFYLFPGKLLLSEQSRNQKV